MVRTVLFDFYGTLARAVQWGPTMEEVLAGKGVRLDSYAEARLNANLSDGLVHTAESADRDTYVAWEQARLRGLAEACGTPETDLDEVVADLYAASKDYVLEAYEEVPATVAELRSRAIGVAVCSNWDWDLDGALARVGLDGLFDVVVTSAQAGSRKPDRAIYDHTLRRCGVAPSDALFVGDTWEPDVDGPRRAGIASVYLWRPGEHDGPPPEGTIADLRAVLDLI